jgi:glycosyltransferase involved in cell wall biosynthesis
VRIGVLGPFPPFRGGIATFDYHLWRHLGSRAEAVALNYRRLYPAVIFPGRTQMDESHRPFPVDTDPVFDPFRPWQWPAGWRRLTSHRLDALILSWWTPLFAPSMTAFLGRWRRRVPTRIAFICHNILPHEPLPLTVRLQKEVLRLGDLYVTHWQGDAERLSGWFPGRPVLRQFHPLYDDFPPPVEPDRHGARRRLGIPDGPAKVLLFFGLVRPYKGLDTLLRAGMQLLQGGGEYHLVVAGEFYQDRSHYEPLLGELQARGHLTLHDRFIPNEAVADYFAAADAVVLPYRHATQSGVVPLAYACGRGVVASRAGGLAEVVREGESGVLVAPSDPTALAAGIQAFMERQADIERRLPDFSRQFSWERYLDTMLAALDGLAPGGGSPTPRSSVG